MPNDTPEEHHTFIIETAGENIATYRLFMRDGVITENECNGKVEVVLATAKRISGNVDLEDRIIRHADDYLAKAPA